MFRKLVGAMLICVAMGVSAFGQSTVGTLTGIVTDTGTAVLPGVTVKVLNEDTGQSQSTLTNDSGSFNFILPPGSNYTLNVEFISFKKVTVTKIVVRIQDTSTVNVTLQTGDVVTTIQVDASKVDPLLKDPTIGITLGEFELMNLPMVGNDPLSLITTLPGYRANPLGHEYDTVGGLPMSMINTVRDGLSVTDGFTPNGVGSTTILNPDMISEIRLILSPVDAEAGRGNGQVQITTKSGTNRFQWNINYNLRQNAFNSLGSSPNRIKQPFQAAFQYTVSVGGPIWKNHTFYFVNWDQQMTYRRPFAQQNCAALTTCSAAGFTVVPALTDSAKDGIFKFFDGWNTTTANGAVNAANPTVTWPIGPNGEAIAPEVWSGSNLPYDGQLMCFSVFGTRTRTRDSFTDADCGTYYPRNGDGTINWGNPLQGKAIFPTIADPFTGELNWDGHGRTPDRTGYMDRLLAYMPKANYYNSNATTGGPVISYGGDGLNRAAAAYILETQGLANRNTFTGGTFGTGLALDQSQVDHKTINIKIDHNITNNHRVTFSTSFQNDRNQRGAPFQAGTNIFGQFVGSGNTGATARWPDGVNGYATRVPRVMTLNGLSTISSSMVNEARFGISYNKSSQLPPWDNPEDPDQAEFARSFLQTGWTSPGSGNSTPIYYAPGVGTNTFATGLAGPHPMDFNNNILPAGLNTGTGSNGGCLLASSVSSASCETGSVLYNFADTFSWNRGAHAIRSGVELRLTRAHEMLSKVIPSATAGSIAANTARLGSTTEYPSDLPPLNQPGTPIAGQPAYAFNTSLTGLLDTSRGNARDLLYFLSGSVQQVSQQFWVNSVDNYRFGKWDTWDGDYCPTLDDLNKFCPGEGQQIRNTVQNEYAFFIKDDWKIGKRLTLNLGVRYESYGNLYTKGFATNVQDAGYGLFGPARARNLDTTGYVPFVYNYNPFDTWLTPGNTFVTGYGTLPPAINVTGQFLPNGACSYIPGNSSSNANDRNPDGTCASTVPTTIVANDFRATAACVYGVQQNPLLPVSNCQPNLLITRIFVGPDSKPEADPNAPDYSKIPSTYRDRNNIGPAIGFSYRLGLGSRTVLVRGGFQFTYGSAGRDRSIATGSASSLTNRTAGNGLTGAADQLTVSCGNTTLCPGLTPGLAFTLADLPLMAPLAPSAAQVPAIGGTVGTSTGANSLATQLWGQPLFNITAYAPHYQDARTENYTLSLATNITRESTLQISYVGTLGRNRPTAVNLNMPNVYGKNPDGSWANGELLQALNDTRAGKDSPLFDEMLAGLNLSGFTGTAGAANGYGNVGTCVAVAANLQPGVNNGGPDNNFCGPTFIYQSGSAHIRRNVTLRTNLANGNYNAVMTTLVNPNSNGGLIGGFAGNTGETSFSTVTNAFSTVLRNGCDRLGTGGVRVNIDSGSIAGNTNGALGGNPGPVRCFPEDYARLSSNVDQLTYNDNWGYTNYHQLQFQYTLRMPSGVNLQATYLTSKTLALPRDFYRTSNYNFNAGGGNFGGAVAGAAPPVTGFANPQTEESRALDYSLSSDSLKHSVRLNGVFGLPFGPGKALLSKAPGWVNMIVGGWQMSIIYNAQSGSPFSIAAGDMLYGDSSGGAIPENLTEGTVAGVPSGGGCNAYSGTVFSPSANAALNCQSGLSFPDVVSPLWRTPTGKPQVNGPLGETTYFGYPSPFALIRDPQCTNGQYVNKSITDPGTFSLANSCGLQALVMKVPEGTPGAFPLGPALSTPTSDTTPVLIMLQNPLPGRNGSLGAQTMRQPSRFYLDASLSKSFMLTERRGVQLRVDATNVLNHPQASDLYFSLGPGGTFNDMSNATTRALANGCSNQYTANSTTANSGLQNGSANCGRQVQVSFRMINN